MNIQLNDEGYIISEDLGRTAKLYQVNHDGTVAYAREVALPYDFSAINSVFLTDKITVYHQNIDTLVNGIETYVVQYDNRFDSIRRIDIHEHLMPNSRTRLRTMPDNHYLAISSRPSDDTLLYNVFDADFKKVWSHVFFDDDVNNFIKIPGQNRYMHLQKEIVTFGDSLQTDFQLGYFDEEGSYTKISNFSTKPGKDLLVKNLVIKDKILIVDGSTRGPDENGYPDRFVSERYTFAIDLTSTGLYTSIAEAMANIDMSVYPNPCLDFLNLSTSISSTSYKIVDMMGQSVLTGILDGSAIDVSRLSPSMYVVMVQTPDNSIASTTFIKQ